MTTTVSWTPTRSADQHTWDDHPHVVWDTVPVVHIRLYDVIAQCLQVQGIASAEHRGKPAIRLDLENVAAGGKGRLVLTTDQVVSDVKRYDDGPTDDPGRSAAQVLASAASGRREAASTDSDAIVRAARAWADAGPEAESYEDDEQRLFAFLCAGVGQYSLMLLHGDGTDLSDPRLAGIKIRRENRRTLDAIAENVVDEPV